MPATLRIPVSLSSAPAVSQPKNDEDKKDSKPADKKKSKAGADKGAAANSTGLFGRLLGKMGLSGTSKAHLPDDKDQSIVWCEKTKVYNLNKCIYLISSVNI